MACKPLRTFMKLTVVTISQEFMLMIEKYPRLLVQHQADHIHALGWESLVRYIILLLDCFCDFMLLLNTTTIKLFNLEAWPGQSSCVGFWMCIKYWPTIVLQMEFYSTPSSLNGTSLVPSASLMFLSSDFPRNIISIWYCSLSYFKKNVGGSTQPGADWDDHGLQSWTCQSKSLSHLPWWGSDRLCQGDC